jgi:flavin-dependent dehydrogenase
VKIAIVGMGVAGSYLASRLSGEHKIQGFERFSEKAFDCICAWGASKHGIKPYVERCGLDFEDYIIHEGKTMYVKMGNIDSEVKLNGLVTFDKHRLLADMHRDTKINYGAWIRNTDRKNLAAKFDLVIDATGYRVLLPTPKDQILVPSVQFRVKYDDHIPFDDFYIEIPNELSGYLWYFPLSKNVAHVGAGDVHHSHKRALKKFFTRYPGKKTKIVGRPIRICPPSMCQPIYQGKVVGVGESVGAVFPVLGEGIIPSLQCSELLVENIHSPINYSKQVLEDFQIYEIAFKYVRSAIKNEYVFPDYLMQMQTLIDHILTNQSRYGYDISSAEPLLRTMAL